MPRSSDLDSDSPQFSDSSDCPPPPLEPRLRGLRWRSLLAVLPSCPAPVDSLRRAAANGRRRYAELRRRLIVDPHFMEDAQKADHLSVDNPLSQDPESVWGRYFRNAELERTIESDLARLYPEHGSFFQTSVCQAMLRRILLVWALSHPEYGYRQGMHEVLAPLVYVLHMDVTHLSQVRQRYEDPFEDRFDSSFEESFTYGKEGKQTAATFSTIRGDENWVERVHPDDSALVEPDDFGFNLETMVLGSDSYGAEGELGALLSGRFVEHDAYCMFDAVLRGQGGPVVLADYFMTASDVGSASGLSPVLEASAAMYRTLAMVDMSLYLHLLGLGVEPQFFALRWLRVLFGREFDLDKLLLLWDAIFAAPNTAVADEGSTESGDDCKSSPRGSFISSFAVSMLLYLRPTLLAAPNATSCLQKLLNFPKNADVRNLIDYAKALQLLAEDADRIPPSPIAKFARIFDQSRGGKHKSGSHSPPFQAHIPAANKVLQHRHPGSPEMVRSSLPDSYWEERWKSSVLPKEAPEEVYHPLMDSGGRDLPSTPASSNASADHKVKPFKESEKSNRSPRAYNIDVSNKSSRRKLLTGLVEGDTSSVPPAESEVTRVRPLSSTTHLNEGDSSSTARAASRDRSSEVGVNDSLTSDDGETSFCGDEEDAAAVCRCSLAECTDATVHMDNQSCTTSAAGECPGCCTKSGFQDESSRTSHLKIKTNGAAKLPDIPSDKATKSRFARHCSKRIASDISVENIESNNVNSDNGVDTYNINREKGEQTALHTLGHSMAENIQVLESALAHSSSLRKEGAPVRSTEEPEHLSKNTSNGKGQVNMLSALAELRKISSILLQM